MTTYDPPGGLPWGLYGLTGASLLLNLVLLGRLVLSPTPEVGVVSVVVPEPAAMVTPVEPVHTVATTAAEPGEPAVSPEVGLPDGVQKVNLIVEHSLARTFSKGLGKDEGGRVAAVVARLFVWDLNLRRDLQPGDRIDVAWEGTGPDLSIPAARYTSRRKGTFSAYRYQPEGSAWPSWWNAEGVEVSRALVDGPIEDYQQITSLLKDRPRHRGMDFKAPEGTPVLAPRDGKVTRANWNLGANGNCLEIRYSDGVMARFLHLSANEVQAGDRVTKGQVVALSGNTGRSTAPHLHYELDRKGTVIDPVDYHGVEQRTLPAQERARFLARVERLDAWIAPDGK